MQAGARWLALAWLAATMLLSPAVAEERVLHDGSRYEGEVNHAGDPHGRGVKTWFDGSRYEGEFRDGRLHGQGVLAIRFQFRAVWDDDDYLLRSEYNPGVHRYEGEFRDGMFHGRGVMTWADGTRYEGGYHRGMFHGRGVMTWADGTRYEGGFRNGGYHGRGVKTETSGERIEGIWDEGTIHRGVYTSPDGYRVTCFPGEPCPSTPSPR